MIRIRVSFAFLPLTLAAVAIVVGEGAARVPVLASLAEFERELIRVRVSAGQARVKATGRTRSGLSVGRPRRDVDLEAVARLRAERRSWRE